MDLTYIIKNQLFFIKLFCTHYPFKRAEIQKYHNKIEWGSCTYSFFDSEYEHFFRAQPGLIFNNQITWDWELFDQADFHCDHLAGTWIGTHEIPFDKKEEVGASISVYINSNVSRYSPSEYEFEVFELYQNKSYEKEKFFTNSYEKSNSEVLKSEIEKVKNDELSSKLLILNSTFFKATLKQLLLKNSTFSIRSFFDITF